MKCRNESILNQKKETAHILSFIISTTDKVDWEIKGKELSLKGKLYDVISINKSNGKIIINCKPDEKEDNILAQYKYIAKGKTNHDPAGIAFKYLIDLKYISEADTNTQLFFPVDKDRITPKNINPHSIYLETVSPPPKC